MSAAERASEASSAEQASAEQASERCEQTSERMSEWPITNISILRRFESPWNGGLLRRESQLVIFKRCLRHCSYYVSRFYTCWQLSPVHSGSQLHSWYLIDVVASDIKGIEEPIMHLS